MIKCPNCEEVYMVPNGGRCWFCPGCGYEECRESCGVGVTYENQSNHR